MDVFKLDIESLGVETFETEPDPAVSPSYDYDDADAADKTVTRPCCC